MLTGMPHADWLRPRWAAASLTRSPCRDSTGNRHGLARALAIMTTDDSQLQPQCLRDCHCSSGFNLKFRVNCANSVEVLNHWHDHSRACELAAADSDSDSGSQCYDSDSERVDDDSGL